MTDQSKRIIGDAKMPERSSRTPREWPVKKQGWLLIEDHDEDGNWSGFATSDAPIGNIKWATEAVPIRVTGEPTFNLSEVLPLVEALRKTVLWADMVSIRVSREEHEALNFTYLNDGRKILAQFQKLMEEKKK